MAHADSNLSLVYSAAVEGASANDQFRIWLYSDIDRTVAQITTSGIPAAGTAGDGRLKDNDLVFVRGSNGVGLRITTDDAGALAVIIA